jgi:hypothetical protein
MGSNFKNRQITNFRIFTAKTMRGSILCGQQGRGGVVEGGRLPAIEILPMSIACYPYLLAPNLGPRSNLPTYI